MRVFGLQPDQVLARGAASSLRAPAAPLFPMVYGAASLGFVSVLAYSIWAWKLIGGEGPMYAAIAAIYIGLAGIALSRLVVGAGTTARFAALFAVAFLAYAVAWCVFWFGLHGKHHADLWGSAVGLAALTWLVMRAFGQIDDFLPIFAVVFSFHTLGYYLGDVLHANFRGAPGRLLWGAAHGIGFGAGIGYLLHRCQEPLKLRLRSSPTA